MTVDWGVCVPLLLMSILPHTLQMTLPWGPYFVSRAGRAAPMDQVDGQQQLEQLEELEDGTYTCCAAGPRVETIYVAGTGLTDIVRCTGDIPCCPGLEDVIRFTPHGHQLPSCETKTYQREEEEVIDIDQDEVDYNSERMALMKLAKMLAKFDRKRRSS